MMPKLKEMQNNPEQLFKLYQELLDRGIPSQEAKRAAIAYFSQLEPPSAEPWPGPITGLDLTANISTIKVPDTGVPLTNFAGLPQSREPWPTSYTSPYGMGSYTTAPTPDSMSLMYDVTNSSANQSANWLGLASDVNSQPSMANEHGHTATLSIPPIPDDYESLHSDSRIRSKGIEPSGAQECTCNKHLQESVSNLRNEFSWLTDDYIESLRELTKETDGQLFLIRAASESITDHRGEGEQYRRKLSSDELNSMTRTIIGKGMDVNHQPELETDAIILDADFDKNRREIQTIVLERDPQIIEAINDGKISAVSINGGLPRTEIVGPCEHDCVNDNCELCMIPQGVVLGELDGIGMTWVVTDPRGIYWNGNFVPNAEPGIKTTKIEAL